jgi:branched-chain amino acid transport system ATP-binding protein
MNTGRASLAASQRLTSNDIAAGKSDSTLQATDTALNVRSVRAGYNWTDVLNGVSIEAARGECVASLGPNGVGKTTLMRAITGVVSVRSGNIEWNGRRIDGLPTHQITRFGIAMVPEGRRLYGGMTVEENLLMGAFIVPKSETRRRLDALYQAFELLKERREQLAGTLSGGQQQLCAIGRAMMSNPSLLLIDELSLGLSPAAIKTVIEAIRIARKMFDPTMLVVDQDIRVAGEIATRGYFLDRGQVVASGPMSELTDASLVHDLYLSAGLSRRKN